jgi:gluconolactonase
MRYIFFFLLSALLIACSEKEPVATIEQLDPSLSEIIEPGTKVKVIADGFQWSEGPLWVQDQQMLLFSDVPENTIYQWTEKGGLKTYLHPSGYTGQDTTNAGEGSNGLLLNAYGELILCQHGDRRMAKMKSALNAPSPVFESLADSYQGKKFNSPNDATYKSNGDLFFTDPPYGLKRGEKDSAKELPFQGVYRLGAQGSVTLLVDSLTRPNGIAFLPGEITLLVANSDPAKAIWYAYDLIKEDSLANGRVFCDATALTATEKGLPDGLKVTHEGVIFATGPGGVWIFNTDGKVLGKIKTTTAASNCALSFDQKVLFITADNYVLSVTLK